MISSHKNIYQPVWSRLLFYILNFQVHKRYTYIGIIYLSVIPGLSSVAGLWSGGVGATSSPPRIVTWMEERMKPGKAISWGLGAHFYLKVFSGTLSANRCIVALPIIKSFHNLSYQANNNGRHKILPQKGSGQGRVHPPRNCLLSKSVRYIRYLKESEANVRIPLCSCESTHERYLQNKTLYVTRSSILLYP